MQGEDSAWKEIIEDLFQQFLAFFFPAVEREIDWSEPVEFLDSELQGLFPDLRRGKNRVDKLAKVSLKDGSSRWILVHIEVEGRGRPGFDLRMLHYNVRLGIRYGKDVLSLAILTDVSPRFRPGFYHQEFAGMVHTFRYPVVKLLDFAARKESLEEDPNPFSLVVLAHLEAPRAKGDWERLGVKFALTERLYKRGYSEENILRLLRFLDWILRLPPELDLEFRERVCAELEGHRPMPYLAQFERIAMEKGEAKGRAEGEAKGRVEGLREGIRVLSRHRYGRKAATLLPAIEALEDPKLLRRILKALGRGAELEEVRALIRRG